MALKNQSSRLTKQHKESHGEIGIFGIEAQKHDSLVCSVSKEVAKALATTYPQLSFRYRPSITKKEINDALQQIDIQLGQTLFLPNSSIKPDGGLVEARDDNGKWRVILGCVSKFTGMHFRHLLMPFCVFKPRFTSSKPSVFILELQENLLETAPVSF